MNGIGAEIFWLAPLFPLAVFVILAVGIPVAGKITSFVSDGVRREDRAMASIAPTLTSEELASEVEGRGDARHRPENLAPSVPRRLRTLADNLNPTVPRQPYLSAGIAIAAMTCASIVSILGLIDVAQGRHAVVTLPWLSIASYRLTLALWLDPLSAVIATLVSLVGLIVFIYAASYMAEDQHRGRFFAEFSLFTGSMLALVLAADLITLFIAWELVGLCSYLLIGFWFERPGAPAAASKAFFITRLADLAFLAGVLLLIGTIGTGNISTILRVSTSGHIPYGLLLAIALLLFAGAAGKSAQVPFQGWLPDAMLGPTPVSALLHSATMVAAGVFLVARLYPLFQAADPSLLLVAWVGVITSLLGGAAALVDRDLKRTLAYSTMSQIGLMFVGLGAGSLAAGILLLIAQAFYKATLFMAAGAVDSVVEGTAFERMGGLAKRMPHTAITFAIAAAALAGLPITLALPPKDPVLAAAWQANSALYIAALVASVLTALYSTRAFGQVFLGTGEGEEGADRDGGAQLIAPLHPDPQSLNTPSQQGREAHEARKGLLIPLLFITILIPIALLANASLLGSPLSRFLGVAEPDVTTSTIIAIIIAVIGVIVALWARLSEPTAIVWTPLKPAAALFDGEFGLQALYSLLTRAAFAAITGLGKFDHLIFDTATDVLAKTAIALVRASARFDARRIDAAVRDLGRGILALSQRVRAAQTGRIENYLLLIFLWGLGVIAVAIVAAFVR